MSDPSFLKHHPTSIDSNLQESDDEDVKADVLFPTFRSPSRDDSRIDLDAFQEMVHDRVRQLSMGSLNRVLSRQNQLYGASTSSGETHQVRFIIYSPSNLDRPTTRLKDLLTFEAQGALESIGSSKGWWLDVVCPTLDEMEIISKAFRIHPLTTEDIQAQEAREKVEMFPNYTFVCFRAFDINPETDKIEPYSFYCLIFKEGFITFHFKLSKHGDRVRKRCDKLKEHMNITPDWINYALIDSITDSFAPVILEVEMAAVSIDEVSLVLKKVEQSEMLKRISRCRKKSTQLSRLLVSKLDVIKSLMKRYEDKTRELNLIDQQKPLPIQLNSSLKKEVPQSKPKLDKVTTLSIAEIKESIKSFTNVLLYLGDIQDHIVTMAQNINHCERILHRAHTNYLAQVNIELTETYNATNGVMNRLTFLATVFIPLTVICSLWGMNVQVPGSSHIDYTYFFWILTGMTIYCLCCLYFGKRLGIL